MQAGVASQNLDEGPGRRISAIDGLDIFAKRIPPSPQKALFLASGSLSAPLVQRTNL
jgi:hypothetical protein